MPYRLRVTEEEVRQELAKMGFTELSDDTVAAMRKDLLKMIKSDLRKLKQERRAAGHIGSGDSQPAAAPRHTQCTHLHHPARASQAPKTTHTKETSHSSLSASHVSEDRDESTGESGYSDFESSTSDLSVTASHSLDAVIPQRQGSAEVKIRKGKAADDKPTVRKKDIASCTDKEPGEMSYAEATTLGRKTAGKRKIQVGKKGLPQYPSRPDPVRLYHYYKAHWDQYKAPGEDPRLKLRWGVRSKLFYAE